MKMSYFKSLGVCCGFLATFFLTSLDANAQCTADPGCAADIASAEYATVIAADAFCCDTTWDGVCQSAYDTIGGQPNPAPECAPDCPDGTNIGDTCNDGNPETFGDVVGADCICAGSTDLGNQVCEGAEPIACGASVSGSTVGALADVAPFCGTGDGTGGGRWYTYTSSDLANVTLSLCSGTAFDSKVRVFTGACGVLVCEAGNDDACALQSEVTFEGAADVTYYILVHGFSAAAGSFELNVSCESACPDGSFIGDSCDDENPNTFVDVIGEDCVCAGVEDLGNQICEGAEAIACGASVSGSTVGALPDVAPTCGTTNGTGGGRWYAFTADVSGSASFDLCAADYDSKIRVFSGSCAELVCVGGNDDNFAACGSAASFVEAPVVAGETYLVLVHGFGSSAGNYTLTVSCEVGCPSGGFLGDACNDGDPFTIGDTIDENCDCIGTPADGNEICFNAETVSCGSVVTGSTVGASVDVAPTCLTSSGTGGGRWYAFSSATDEEVTFSLCNSDYDSKIRVYTGACDALVCVTGNDDFCALQSQVTTATAAGVTYYVLVHGFSTAEGNYELAVTCAVTFDCPALEANVGDACDAEGNEGVIDENCDCVPVGCTADGGTLVYTGSQSFCVGTGTPTGANVTVTGASGSLQRWALINSAGDIVETRGNNSQFNLDVYPAGDYSIRYIRFEADANININNISQVGDLSGCFDLATNSVNLFLREEPNGGTLTALTPTSVCANSGAATSIQVAVSGNTGENFRFGLTSQAAGNQVISVNASGGFNLNGLAPGNYNVAHISYQQGVSVVGVQFASELSGCFDLSNLISVTINSCNAIDLSSSPNPTAGQSFVTFTNAVEEYATLEVYDMSGRMIERLFNQVTTPGQEYRLEFNANNLPNGVYLYRLTTDSEVIVDKFMIAR
jgi:hypothetical protein